MRTQYLLIVTSLELGLEPSRKIASLLCAHCRRLKKLSDMSRARRRIQRRRRALSLRKKKENSQQEESTKPSRQSTIVFSRRYQRKSSLPHQPNHHHHHHHLQGDHRAHAAVKKGDLRHILCVHWTHSYSAESNSAAAEKKYFGTDWSGARGWGTTFRESRKLFFLFFLVVYMIFFICENQTQTCTTQNFSVLKKNVIHPKKNSITKKSIAVNALLWPEFVSGWAIHDFTHSRSFSQDLVCR